MSGSEAFDVIITLSAEDDILSSSCNCPYDYGPVCKHETAAYFELMDETEEESDVVTGVQKTLGLFGVLNGLQKELLIRIIAELAEEDEVLENRILMMYSIHTDIDNV